MKCETRVSLLRLDADKTVDRQDCSNRSCVRGGTREGWQRCRWAAGTHNVMEIKLWYTLNLGSSVTQIR